MTVATTSRIAYKGIQADGTEATQRLQIMQAIARHGPMTRREISRVTGIEPGAVGGRVNALIDAKLLTDDGKKRKCCITGKLVKEVRLP